MSLRSAEEQPDLGANKGGLSASAEPPSTPSPSSPSSCDATTAATSAAATTTTAASAAHTEVGGSTTRKRSGSSSEKPSEKTVTLEEAACGHGMMLVHTTTKAKWSDLQKQAASSSTSSSSSTASAATPARAELKGPGGLTASFGEKLVSALQSSSQVSRVSSERVHELEITLAEKEEIIRNLQRQLEAEHFLSNKLISTSLAPKPKLSRNWKMVKMQILRMYRLGIVAKLAEPANWAKWLDTAVLNNVLLSITELVEFHRMLVDTNMQWHHEFLVSGGLVAMIRLLTLFDSIPKQKFDLGKVARQSILIKCFLIVIDHRSCLDYILEENSVLVLLFNLIKKTTNMYLRSRVLSVYTALVMYSPKGVSVLKKCLMKCSRYASPYTLLLEWLDEGDEGIDFACLRLINALIKTPFNTLEDRVEIRNIFIQMQIMDLLQSLKATRLTPQLEAQIDLFCECKEADEKEYAQLKREQSVETMDLPTIGSFIISRAKTHPDLTKRVLSIFRAMTRIPEDDVILSLQIWNFVAKALETALEIAERDNMDEIEIAFEAVTEALKTRSEALPTLLSSVGRFH
ncbi:hypothetical protein Pelo_4784 [Pelomyxa schiedti]|nr:hypothetical protein Pelo_4784 [Pelomyxa schiedti]